MVERDERIAVRHVKDAPPKKLNERGQCCGRKPMRYRVPPRLFCCRCDAEFSVEGQQQSNFAYTQLVNGDFRHVWHTIEDPQNG